MFQSQFSGLLHPFPPATPGWENKLTEWENNCDKVGGGDTLCVRVKDRKGTSIADVVNLHLRSSRSVFVETLETSGTPAEPVIHSESCPLRWQEFSHPETWPQSTRRPMAVHDWTMEAAWRCPILRN
ncbi:hypothetical protein PoB_000494800 [Plakobranchus ocellatus]|uniref:Uncharacterized protein n=1 Tax=Plakobranchus ocellatus TaxID=259542 RepID=A0AAV3Y8E9_9GAST|nr:hypothetical protein PoB_000494800 [Plakobranchus ocellatus]